MNVLRGGDFFFAMIQLLQVKKKFKKWLFWWKLTEYSETMSACMCFFYILYPGI